MARHCVGCGTALNENTLGDVCKNCYPKCPTCGIEASASPTLHKAYCAKCGEFPTTYPFMHFAHENLTANTPEDIAWYPGAIGIWVEKEEGKIRVFVHFRKKPTLRQMEELRGLGVTIYCYWCPCELQHTIYRKKDSPGYVVADIPAPIGDGKSSMYSSSRAFSRSFRSRLCNCSSSSADKAAMSFVTREVATSIPGWQSSSPLAVIRTSVNGFPLRFGSLLTQPSLSIRETNAEMV